MLTDPHFAPFMLSLLEEFYPAFATVNEEEWVTQSGRRSNIRELVSRVLVKHVLGNILYKPHARGVAYSGTLCLVEVPVCDLLDVRKLTGYYASSKDSQNYAFEVVAHYRRIIKLGEDTQALVRALAAHNEQVSARLDPRGNAMLLPFSYIPEALCHASKGGVMSYVLHCHPEQGRALIARHFNIGKMVHRHTGRDYFDENHGVEYGSGIKPETVVHQVYGYDNGTVYLADDAKIVVIGAQTTLSAEFERQMQAATRLRKLQSLLP